MYSVMLHPGWESGLFGRTVSGEERSQRMTFQATQPVQVEAWELEFLRADIGKALVIAKYDEKQRPYPDWDKTSRIHDGEAIEDVFADEPPVVETVDGSDEITIEESRIPEKYHAALKSVNLNTLEAIDGYLSGGGKLTEIKGIGEPSAKEIMEALESHAAPEQ